MAQATEDNSSARPFTIGMIVFPGMTYLDLAGPHDLLARLPDTKVLLLAKDLEPVRTDIQTLALPDTTLVNAPRLDMLFIGGGPGVNALLRDDVILTFLERRALEAQWITSVCTGALVLGAAGLLRGYKAATHWTVMEALRPFGAEPTYERVVVDRNRITGGGVTAGIDFGLTVAKLLHGDGLAQVMQLAMEYDPRPPFDAGSPEKAPAAITERVRKITEATTAERLALAKAISRERGWDRSE